VDGVLQPRFSTYSVGIPLSTGPHVVKCRGRISESADCTCEDSETINVAAIGRPFVVVSTGIVYFRLLNFSFFHLCCATTYVGEIKLYIYSHIFGRLDSRVVSVLDPGAEGPGFKSHQRRCRVAVLGKLFTPIVSPFTKQRNWQQPF